jgi:uncharacterized protein
MLHRIALYCVILCGALLPLQGVVHAEQAVPKLRGHVNDYAQALSAGASAELETKLSEFEGKKGSQIVLLVVPSTLPETIEEYAIRVAEAWRLGRKGVDDGVLLLIAKEDRAVRIEVGRGLEGALTDFTSKRIVEDFIVPKFRGGDFDGGVREGTDAILKVVSGEPLPDYSPPAFDNAVPVLVFLLLFFPNLFIAFAGRLWGSAAFGVAAFLVSLFFFATFVSLMIGTGAFFLAMAMAFGSRASGSRSGWTSGGFSSSSGSSSYSGGGGGFSGGGASGRW